MPDLYQLQVDSGAPCTKTLHLIVKSLTIDALALDEPEAVTPAEPGFFSKSFQNFKLSSAANEYS